MTTTVRESTWEGLPALVVESDEIRTVVLPGLGAKVGDSFEAYDISGWDECFPTIGEVVYPEAPWQGVTVPDHGELWSLPWQWSDEGGALRMWTYGVRFGYRFERTFRFTSEGRVVIDYVVENLTPFPFKTLWSMHPFFVDTPGNQVLLPAGVRVRVEVAGGERLGAFLAEHPWPVTVDRLGTTIDLSRAEPPDERFMAKLFTTPLAEGWAALIDENDGHFLAFTFDPTVVPFVGLALMRGGWPESGEASRSVILEPCSGWPDRLDLAITRGACAVVPASGTRRWQVTLQLGIGRDRLDRALRPDSGTYPRS
jgi:hypothetical protein